MIRKEWIYKKKKCVILWVSDHFCAYVETKLKDVSYAQEFGTYETSPSSNIEAHGGLTFSGGLDDFESLKGIHFFGCDYAHLGDYVRGMSHREGDKKWTLEKVEKETEEMADSIIKYEKVYNKYKKAFEDFKKKLKEIEDAKGDEGEKNEN